MRSQAIHKYRLQIKDGVQVVHMSPNANMLTVQIQGKDPILWAQVDPEGPKVPRYVKMFSTGKILGEDDVLLKHLGTVQLHGGILVYHFFEVAP